MACCGRSCFCIVMYLSVGTFACVGKCRSYGAQSAFICVSPGFHIGLRPHSTLGFAGVSPLQGSFRFCLRVSPGFHIGLCPHSTLGFAGVPPRWGSFYFVCVYPGFHFGLCPHSTLGCAGVPPLQGSLSDWAFAVLCCGIGGIDCCGRAMSPNGAILLHSPGRKPWVNHWNRFIEPLKGRH